MSRPLPCISSSVFSPTAYLLCIDRLTDETETKRLISTRGDFALVRRSLILHENQIWSALYKAYHSQKRTTKSLYTELLYLLAVEKGIAKSFQEVGPQWVDGVAHDVICVHMGSVESLGEITRQLNCTSVDWDLNVTADKMENVRLFYKIGEKELLNSNLVDSVITRVACKGIL